MKTTCEHCLFRTNYIPIDVRIQTGCKLNQLEKFEKTEQSRGQDIFYVLEGLCRPCRNVNWNYYQDNPDASIEMLQQQAIRESNVGYDVVVAHNKTDSVEDSVKLIKAVDLLSYPPKKITFVTNKTLEEAKQLYIDLVPHTKIPVKIEISNISDDEYDLLASGVIQPTKSQFLLCCLNGTEIKNEDIVKVNELVNRPQGLVLGLFTEYYIADSKILSYLGKHTVELARGTMKILVEQGQEGLIYNGTEG